MLALQNRVRAVWIICWVAAASGGGGWEDREEEEDPEEEEEDDERNFIFGKTRKSRNDCFLSFENPSVRRKKESSAVFSTERGLLQPFG